MSTPGRAAQFFQGLFLPTLFAALGLATYPLWVDYDYAHQRGTPGQGAVPTAILLALLGTGVLCVRWWGPARTRAFGLLAGLLLAPPLLVALFFLAVIVLKIPLVPR